MPKADEGNVSRGLNLVRIEPDERLVIVARTIQATDRVSRAELKGAAAERARFGETCLGQALYRHRSVLQGVSDQPHWSHLELSYFRETIPADAIRDLVSERQPPGID